MGALRVTQGIIATRVLNNIQDQTRKLLALQEQLSTGLRVNSPSDDPIDARRAINAREILSKNTQFLENISNALPYLEETASTIQNVQQIYQRVRELTLQGANGTNGQPQLDAIAEEINQLLESAVAEGNHNIAGRYIFSGTRTKTEAFSVTRNGAGQIDSVTYEGNDETFELAIGTDATVVVNEPGSGVFLDLQDQYQTLIDIRDNLNAGNIAGLQTQLAELDNIDRQLGQGVARVGAVINRIELTEGDLVDFNFQLESLLSDRLDADFAETILKFNTQQNAYQAALTAGANSLQRSLLDFLR
jgi:flagellar hook-associated protein 3 FlgL